MKRFWFEFKIDKSITLPPGIGIGCGVTALDYNDALGILEAKVFTSVKPEIKTVIEDVNVLELDQGHVIPNMNSPVNRGIWFPIGYD